MLVVCHCGALAVTDTSVLEWEMARPGRFRHTRGLARTFARTPFPRDIITILVDFSSTPIFVVCHCGALVVTDTSILEWEMARLGRFRLTRGLSAIILVLLIAFLFAVVLFVAPLVHLACICLRLSNAFF